MKLLAQIDVEDAINPTTGRFIRTCEVAGCGSREALMVCEHKLCGSHWSQWEDACESTPARKARLEAWLAQVAA